MLYIYIMLGNDKKWELPVLFWPEPGVPEYNNSGRACCWLHLFHHYPFSPVFDQKRPGAPDYCYFAQLPPAFGHLMFPSGGLLEQTNPSGKNKWQENFAPLCMYVSSSHKARVGSTE